MAWKSIQRVLSKDPFETLPSGPTINRLYSSYPVVRWCRGKTIAADHCAANDKVHLAHGRSRSLAFEHLEVVTAVGRVWLGRVTFLQCLCYFRPNRLAPSSIRVLPGQAIVFPGTCYNLLRVLIYL